MNEIANKTNVLDANKFTLNILNFLVAANSKEDLVQKIVISLKEMIGFEAGAIRLKKGEEFAYHSWDGFDENHIRAENHICHKNSAGEIIFNEMGNPIHECFCGAVLMGRLDVPPQNTTELGGFISNNFPLFSTEFKKTEQMNIRGTCIKEGYKSILLTPLKYEEKVVGIIQLNDRRENFFTPETIAFIEAVAPSITLTFVLALHKKSLSEQEINYRAIFESFNNLILAIDRAGTIIGCNQKVKEVLGYSASELIGYPLKKIVSENEHHKMIENLNQVILSGPLLNIEYKLITKSQKTIDTSINSCSIRSQDGSMLKAFWIIEDISQKKQMEHDKEIFYQKVVETAKMATLGELVAGISHEINNPLTIIQGHTELMQNRIKSNNFVAEDFFNFLDIQMNQAEKIDQIIKGLKTFSGPINTVNDEIGINSSIRNVINVIQTLYQKEGIILKLNLFPDELSFQGNQNQTNQLIMSLLSNAKDATTHLNPNERVIGIETRLEHDKIFFTVSDNGHGITPEIFAKIFDPFFSTKPVGKATGLGLSVVKNVVNSIGGVLHVKTIPELESGSTFTIEIPPAPRLDQTKTQKQTQNNKVDVTQISFSSQLKSKPTKSHLTGSILIVDDEEMIRDCLTTITENIGLTPDTAENGIEALDKVDGKKYDYIITDIRMPLMDGEELIKRLRKHPNFSGKIFAATGGTHKDLVLEGIEGLIEKPFSMKTILALLQGQKIGPNQK